MKRLLSWYGAAMDSVRAAPLRASLRLWLVLLIAVAVKNLAVPDVHNAYPSFEGGARMWLAGQDLFDMSINRCGYRYGPAFAMAFTPLAVLPTPLGSLLWILLTLAMLLAAVYAMERAGLLGTWNNREKALYLLLLLLGTVRSIWSGQSNLLIFSLAALGAVSIAARQWWLAAFLLAVPVHIKIWPVVPAFLLAIYWPKKLAFRFPLAVLAVGAVPFLTAPWAWVWRQYVGWYDLLVGPAQVRHTYRDAWTLWEVIHEPVNARVYMLLQLASAAGVFWLCWRQRSRLSPKRQLLFVLVAWTAWQMTFGPATERATFGLIAPLSAWGLVTALQQRRRPKLMAAAWLIMTASTFGVVERAVMDWFPLVLASHPIGTMLFFLWFLDWNRHTADAAIAQRPAVVVCDAAQEAAA